MAHLPENSINHFIHPQHPLTLFDAKQEYICKGCKTIGTGKRYRCHGCDFDLHEYCATCPRILSSFMHKQHQLDLMMLMAQDEQQENRICDVCTEREEGLLFYRCRECNFHVHPLCTQLPQHLHHALHKLHPLSLESPSIASICAVCKSLCSNWRYRCKVCKFDIHMECILLPTVPCSQTDEPTNQRGIPSFNKGTPCRTPAQSAPYCGPGFTQPHPQRAPYYGQGFTQPYPQQAPYYGQGFTQPQPQPHPQQAPYYGQGFTQPHPQQAPYYGQGFRQPHPQQAPYYGQGLTHAHGYTFQPAPVNNMYYNPHISTHSSMPQNQAIPSNTNNGTSGLRRQFMIAFVSQLSGVISSAVFGID